MRLTALRVNYLDGNDEIVAMWVWALSLGSTDKYESLGKSIAAMWTGPKARL
jgi:hypothetical protein